MYFAMLKQVAVFFAECLICPCSLDLDTMFATDATTISQAKRNDDAAQCLEEALEEAMRQGHLDAARELLLHGVRLRQPLCKEDLEMRAATEQEAHPSPARCWLSPWRWDPHSPFPLCSLGVATRNIWELASGFDTGASRPQALTLELLGHRPQPYQYWHPCRVAFQRLLKPRMPLML